MTWLHPVLATLLGALCCLPLQAQADQETTPDDAIVGLDRDGSGADNHALKVLFIGNSYTACGGGQPNLLAGMLQAREITLSPYTHIRGGETLEGFWLKNAGTEPTYSERQQLKSKKTEAERQAQLENLHKNREKTIGSLDAVLAEGPFDIAIIQSWLGAAKPEEDMGFRRYAGLLAEKIRAGSPDATLILYMTWSSQNDRESQKRITDNCLAVAREHQMVLAPAGEAAWAAGDQRSDLALYRSAKDSHPGYDGAYLIACSLAAAITNRSPEGLPTTMEVPWSYDFPVQIGIDDRKQQLKDHPMNQRYTWSINADTAQFLQKIAWDTFSAYQP